MDLTDGQELIKGIIATQAAQLATDGHIRANTVIRLDNYLSNAINNELVTLHVYLLRLLTL